MYENSIKYSFFKKNDPIFPLACHFIDRHLTKHYFFTFVILFKDCLK